MTVTQEWIIITGILLVMLWLHEGSHGTLREIVSYFKRKGK